MIIRRALPADAPALAALHIACWRDAYEGIFPSEFLDSLSLEDRTDHWLRGLVDPFRHNFVAVLDDELIGFASCGPSRDADALPGAGELYGIYLRRQHWGAGRGHQLWLAAHQQLSSLGLEPITLWVLQANARARTFYDRRGFRPDPGIVRALNRHGLDLPEMRLVLHRQHGTPSTP
jgi:GNAT superfamily N-acetyltransferase